MRGRWAGRIRLKRPQGKQALASLLVAVITLFVNCTFNHWIHGKMERWKEIPKLAEGRRCDEKGGTEKGVC